MNKGFCISEIEFVKSRAKEYRKIFPDLSINKCRDITTSLILRVDSFQEALSLCHEHLNNYFDDSIGCKYCFLQFDPSNRHDFKEHWRRHFEFEKAERYLNFLPSSYQKRESEKAIAYDELNSQCFNSQFKGGLRLIKSHFDRSLEISIDNGDWIKHPKFEQYLVAMINFGNYDNCMSKELLNYFSESFHEESKKHLNGKIVGSVWHIN